VIYSYHSEDPIGNEQILQHQFEGSKTINLFGQQENVPEIPPDVQHFDVINLNVCIIRYQVDNLNSYLQVSVPSKDTTYLCTVMEVPSQFQNQTHYILKVKEKIVYMIDGYANYIYFNSQVL